MRPCVPVMAVLTAAIAAGLAGSAQARQFRNAYVSFELPDDWTCELEETEWVCSPPPRPDGKRDRIIILTAKEVGPTDSPQTYLSHLESVARRPEVSVVQAPRTVLLGDTLWQDATLLGSEIKGYTTRYLARTEGDIGVLVTFSAHRIVADAQPTSDAIAASVKINTSFARKELRDREGRRN